ncbi:odorant receptor Or2-like [Schistocerca cancellata]|uniref:odorant receptor Or2-like n=1 Tax=Schistocerca cancellata TaxID=274614 RepID=UPI0021196E7C|nr:odorant receptor Or2-like [Schistocerca cancellata]
MERHVAPATRALAAVLLWKPASAGRLYHAATAACSAAALSLLASVAAALPALWASGDVTTFSMNAYICFAVFAAQVKVSTFGYWGGPQRLVAQLAAERRAAAAAEAALPPGRPERMLAQSGALLRRAAAAFYLCGHLMMLAWHLLFDAWFPFDPVPSPNYELALLYQSVTLYIAFITTAVIDVFYVSVMVYLGVELEILNEAVARSCRPSEEKGDDDDDCSLLIGCVRHHQALNRCVNTLQEVMGISIFVQFVFNMLLICVYAFVLTTRRSDLSTLAKIGMTLESYLFENLLYCWYGNNLMEQSERLPFSAYSSRWPDGGRRFRQALRILAVRAARPLRVTVGGLYTLSRQTFLHRIMKPKYGDNMELCYQDTVSYIYNIETEDFYEVTKIMIDTFDTSGYPENNICGIPEVNKRVLGKMKDESNGKIMQEFCS